MKLISKCCTAAIKPIYDEEKGDFTLACKKCEKEVSEIIDDFSSKLDNTNNQTNRFSSVKVALIWEAILAYLHQPKFDINELEYKFKSIESQVDAFLRFTKEI